MSTGAAPGPDRREMELLAELVSERTVNRVSKDLLEPVREDVAKVAEDTAVLKHRVVGGNGVPGLIQMFEQAQRDHKDEHRLIHRRIDEIALRHQPQKEKKKEDENLTFRARLGGIWSGVSGTCAFLASLITLALLAYKEFHR